MSPGTLNAIYRLAAEAEKTREGGNPNDVVAQHEAGLMAVFEESLAAVRTARDQLANDEAAAALDAATTTRDPAPE